MGNKQSGHEGMHFEDRSISWQPDMAYYNTDPSGRHPPHMNPSGGPPFPGPFPQHLGHMAGQNAPPQAFTPTSTGHSFIDSPGSSQTLYPPGMAPKYPNQAGSGPKSQIGMENGSVIRDGSLLNGIQPVSEISSSGGSRLAPSKDSNNNEHTIKPGNQAGAEIRRDSSVRSTNNSKSCPGTNDSGYLTSSANAGSDRSNGGLKQQRRKSVDLSRLSLNEFQPNSEGHTLIGPDSGGPGMGEPRGQFPGQMRPMGPPMGQHSFGPMVNHQFMPGPNGFPPGGMPMPVGMQMNPMPSHLMGAPRPLDSQHPHSIFFMPPGTVVDGKKFKKSKNMKMAKIPPGGMPPPPPFPMLIRQNSFTEGTAMMMQGGFHPHGLGGPFHPSGPPPSFHPGGLPMVPVSMDGQPLMRSHSIDNVFANSLMGGANGGVFSNSPHSQFTQQPPPMSMATMDRRGFSSTFDVNAMQFNGMPAMKAGELGLQQRGVMPGNTATLQRPSQVDEAQQHEADVKEKRRKWRRHKSASKGSLRGSRHSDTEGDRLSALSLGNSEKQDSSPDSPKLFVARKGVATEKESAAKPESSDDADASIQTLEPDSANSRSKSKNVIYETLKGKTLVLTTAQINTAERNNSRSSERLSSGSIPIEGDIHTKNIDLSTGHDKSFRNDKNSSAGNGGVITNEFFEDSFGFGSNGKRPVKISPEAQAIMDRNAAMLGLKPLEQQDSREVQSCRSKSDLKKNINQEPSDSEITKVTNVDDVPLGSGLDTKPKSQTPLTQASESNKLDISASILPVLPRRSAPTPDTFEPMDAWKNIDVHREVARRQPNRDAPSVPDQANEDTIVPQTIPCPPSRQLSNCEPIYLEYDDHLPDFKKRLIETGAFDFPEKHSCSEDRSGTPLGGSSSRKNKKSDKSNSRNDLDSNPGGREEPANAEYSIPEPKRNWKSLMMPEKDNSYYPAHSESTNQIRSRDYSGQKIHPDNENTKGHNVPTGDSGQISPRSSGDGTTKLSGGRSRRKSTDGKGSIRALKNSVSNMFRRSKSSDRGSGGKSQSGSQENLDSYGDGGDRNYFKSTRNIQGDNIANAYQTNAYNGVNNINHHLDNRNSTDDSSPENERQKYMNTSISSSSYTAAGDSASLSSYQNNGSMSPQTAHINAGDSSDIDFSWVQDLENKFKRTQGDEERIRQTKGDLMQTLTRSNKNTFAGLKESFESSSVRTSSDMPYSSTNTIQQSLDMSFNDINGQSTPIKERKSLESKFPGGSNNSPPPAPPLPAYLAANAIGRRENAGESKFQKISVNVAANGPQSNGRRSPRFNKEFASPTHPADEQTTRYFGDYDVFTTKPNGFDKGYSNNNDLTQKTNDTVPLENNVKSMTNMFEQETQQRQPPPLLAKPAKPLTKPSPARLTLPLERYDTPISKDVTLRGLGNSSLGVTDSDNRDSMPYIPQPDYDDDDEGPGNGGMDLTNGGGNRFQDQWRSVDDGPHNSFSYSSPRDGGIRSNTIANGYHHSPSHSPFATHSPRINAPGISPVGGGGSGQNSPSGRQYRSTSDYNRTAGTSDRQRQFQAMAERKKAGGSLGKKSKSSIEATSAHTLNGGGYPSSASASGTPSSYVGGGSSYQQGSYDHNVSTNRRGNPSNSQSGLRGLQGGGSSGASFHYPENAIDLSPHSGRMLNYTTQVGGGGGQMHHYQPSARQHGIENAASALPYRSDDRRGGYKPVYFNPLVGPMK